MKNIGYLARITKALAKSCLGAIGLTVVRRSTHATFVSASFRSRVLDIFLWKPFEAEVFAKIFPHIQSQLGQDLLAVAASSSKQQGFFVEIGATNGVYLSNTFMLEKELGWRGILAEPGKVWHSDLVKNRTAEVFTGAVWHTSGSTLTFLEAHNPELSTLSPFSKSDSHRRSGKTYEVESLTLHDLLKSRNAPTFIDFLSIDTEGSEMDILRGFDFSLYQFGLICVEHNFTSAQQEIKVLLSEVGYIQILGHASLWDSWFVPANH